MWSADYIVICRRFADLRAVYESPTGRLALLLRHPLTPAPEERAVWFHDVQRVAQAVVASLRAAGLGPDTPVILLQGRPPSRVAHVLRHWACRYAAYRTRSGRGEPWRLVDGLTLWYRDMAPCWLAVEPATRRRLLLRAHRWIADHVVSAVAQGEDLPLGDLAPTGSLARLLVRTVPPGELGQWNAWIRLLLTDLRRALAWPASRRSQAWVRWLFLIPYGLPVTGRPTAIADDYAEAGGGGRG